MGALNKGNWTSIVLVAGSLFCFSNLDVTRNNENELLW